MLWIIEYIIYSVIIVFLIDKVYNFLQNNNGVYEIRTLNKSQENIEWKHYEKQKENNCKIDSQLPQQIEMEDELNKLFINDNSKELNNEIVTNYAKIESSNILDLPIDS